MHSSITPQRRAHTIIAMLTSVRQRQNSKKGKRFENIVVKEDRLLTSIYIIAKLIKMKVLFVSLLIASLLLVSVTGTPDCYDYSVTTELTYFELLPMLLYYGQVDWMTLNAG